MLQHLQALLKEMPWHKYFLHHWPSDSTVSGSTGPSGVASIFGALGEWSQQQSLTGILYLKQIHLSLEISFIWWHINAYVWH
jgi:hypothetical protein